MGRNWITWATVVGLVFTIIGVGVSIWYGSGSKVPLYAVSSVNLVPSSVGKYGNVEILSNGHPVPQITVTNICFWNGGRETITRDDIARLDPLRVSTARGVNILSCSIVKASRVVIGPALDQSDWDSPKFFFDFMDRDDYILLQVLHTGRGSKDCMVRGTVEGYGEIQRGPLSAVRTPVDKVILVVIFLFCVCVCGASWFISRQQGKTDVVTRGVILMALILTLVVAVWIVRDHVIGNVASSVLQSYHPSR